MDIRKEDLRLGNVYIGYDDKPNIVDLEFFGLIDPKQDNINLDEIIKCEYQVTKDTMLKLGFELVNDFTDRFTFKYKLFTFSFRPPYNFWYVFTESGKDFVTKIEYLHELQNFIKATDGIELNVEKLFK